MRSSVRLRVASLGIALAASAAVAVTVPSAASAAGTPTTTTVTASPATSFVGQPVVITATVARAATATGLGAILPLPPSGTVTFYDGSTPLGTAQLRICPLAPHCSVQISTSALVAGGHSLIAVYGGDIRFAGSAGTAEETVMRNPTATTLSLSPSTVPNGSPFNATVHVTGSGPTPTGDVLIYLDGLPTSGGTLAGGTVTVSLEYHNQTVGTHTLYAVYRGSGYYALSTSADATETFTTPA